MLSQAEFKSLSREEKFNLIYNEHQAFIDLQIQLGELDGWERSKNKQAKKCWIVARRSILNRIDDIEENLKSYLIDIFEIESNAYAIKIKVCESKVSLYTYRKNHGIKNDYAHGHYGINFKDKEFFARPHGDEFIYRKPCQRASIQNFLSNYSLSFSESAT